MWLHVHDCHTCALHRMGAAKETCGGGEFVVFKPSEVVTHQLGGAHAKQLGQDASPSFARAAQQERRRASVQGSLRQRGGTSASVEACAGRQTSPSTRTGWNRQVQICFWWLHVSRQSHERVLGLYVHAKRNKHETCEWMSSRGNQPTASVEEERRRVDGIGC